MATRVKNKKGTPRGNRTLAARSHTYISALVNHAQRSLSQQTDKLDPDNEYQWRQKEEIQQRFMNVIVAASKKFEIEPFASMAIPTHSNYQNSDYKQFQSDMDHFVTQIIIDNSMRSKKFSVEILPKSKDQIRRYVHGLRECIENSNMTSQKRKILLNKLDSFEKELEKRRMNFLAVTLLSFEILAIPGATWASVDVTQKLVTNITRLVAEAKQLEEQNRQIEPPPAAKALSPPRPSEKAVNWDDEIPF